MRFVAAFLLAMLTCPPLAAGAESVVLLPIENLSGVDGAGEQLAPIIAGALSAKGYRVVGGEDVGELLRTERIRYVDSLSSAAREKLLDRFAASGVLVGTVFTFREDEGAAIAALLRLVRGDGRVAWERFVALSADETEGLMGLGRLDSMPELLDAIGRDIEKSLPAPGSTASPAGARARPFGRSGPRTFRGRELPTGQKARIVVLPFENLSRDLGSPKLVAALTAFRLRAGGTFDVVEPAELRAAVLATGVRSVANPDPADLRKLAEKLGTNLFLTGTIYSSKGATESGDQTPEFELDLSLVDAARASVVCSSHHARRGRDYQGLLEIGAIVSLPVLTDQVVAEMVSAVEKARPQGREKS